MHFKHEMIRIWQSLDSNFELRKLRINRARISRARPVHAFIAKWNLAISEWDTLIYSPFLAFESGEIELSEKILNYFRTANSGPATVVESMN